MEPPPEQVLVSDLDVVEAELADGHPWIVQFDRTPGQDVFVMRFDADETLSESKCLSVSTSDYFNRLNRLCDTFGDQLSVRFYGHYGEVFDARILEQIPKARSLTVNCLEEAANLDAISGLERLTHLSLGVRNLTDKAILSRLPIAQLQSLVLEEADTAALDLAPLAGGSNMRSLKVFGHRKNIDELGALSLLDEFVFNPAKGLALDFINNMVGLTALKLVLGGTEHLRDILLPNLRDLAVTRTRGLTDLGDLQRFGTLRRLLAQDQPHLKSIVTGTGNRDLLHIWLHNCANLRVIAGLEELPAIQSLHASRTGLSTRTIDLLPKTASHAHIAGTEGAGPSGLKREGLVWVDHPDMPFFYK